MNKSDIGAAGDSVAPAAPRTVLLYFRGAVFGIGAVSIWAGWMTVTRVAVSTTLNVWDIAALRFAVAGLILLPIIVRKGWALDVLGWPRLLLLIAGAGAPYALIASQGLRFAPASDAGAIIPGALPLVVALLAAVFLREKFGWPRKVGLVLIFIGVTSIVGDAIFGRDLVRLGGHVLFLTAAILWGCFTVVMRWGKLAPLHATALVSVGSLIGYLPVYLVFAGDNLLRAPVRDLIGQSLYQGVLATVVALTLFGRAVSILGASSGAAFAALVPAMAALLAVVALREWPSPANWIGITWITFGVYLASGGPLPRRFCCGERPGTA